MMPQIEDCAKLAVIGFVKITDRESGEVLLEHSNAVHPENLSLSIARAMADLSNGHVQSMVFGNGASTVSAVGTITYFAPNILGTGAQLYNQTFSKVVDNQSPLNLDSGDNFLTVNHTANTTYSDLVTTCTLEFGEPAGQAAFDDATVATLNTTDANGNPIVSTDASAKYIFNEIGLTSYDPTTGNNLLLCHVIFHPVQKSLNRSLSIVYTLRFVMV